MIFLVRLRDSDRPKQRELLISINLDPNLFPIASEVDPKFHVDMLAAWQKNTSNSVSKNR